MSDSDLYEKNLACFEEHFENVADVLRGVKNQTSSIVWEDGVAVDVELGQGNLYGIPAQKFARAQLDNYFDAPDRYLLSQPEGLGISEISQDMWQFLCHQAMDKGLDTIPAAPMGIVGYLIVVGIGLGLHIEELIERTQARHVIIAEPIPEFLNHSLRVVEWASLVERCHEKGVTLHFTTAQEAHSINTEITNIVRNLCIPILDGAYLFTHYVTHVTNKVVQQFKADARLLIAPRGFYEDDEMMTKNACTILAGKTFRLIDGVPRVKRAEPAFIVASGPSVDDCIDTIKTWQDHAIIISSGSSLQILLHNGIVPDYHAELEPIPEVTDLLRYILERNKDRFANGRFEGIRLIAPLTVHAGALDLFDEAYMFFRDGAASTHAFGNDRRCIHFAGPNVANTSLTLAAVLGFSEVYLFGTDCGMKNDRHHSKDTVYYTTNEFDVCASGLVTCDTHHPGNFGGMVPTQMVLDWSRKFLEDSIGIYALNAFNCSDGVLVGGAKPKVPETVRFSGPPLDKAAVVHEIRDYSPAFQVGDFVRDTDTFRHVADCDHLREAFNEFLEQTGDDEDFEGLYSRLRAFATVSQTAYPGAGTMAKGTMLALPSIVAFYLVRIEDAAIRAELLRDFLEEFRRMIGTMCDGAAAIFRRADEANSSPS